MIYLGLLRKECSKTKHARIQEFSSGGGGVQVSLTKKLWRFCFFSPQLILQKSNGQFQRNLSFFKVPEGVHHFPGAVQLLFPYRNPYNLWFSRGVRTPCPPLNPHLPKTLTILVLGGTFQSKKYTLYHKVQLQLWLVPDKMLNNWYFFKFCKMQMKIFYSVIILLWSFLQRYVSFTASIASCNLKLKITRSWQGAHFLVSRMNYVLVVRTEYAYYVTENLGRDCKNTCLEGFYACLELGRYFLNKKES